MKNSLVIFAISLQFLQVSSCQEKSNFSGQSRTSSIPSKDPVVVPDVPPEPTVPQGTVDAISQKQCAADGTVKVTIKGEHKRVYDSCNQQGNIWDFQRKACVEVSSEEKSLMASKGFSCTYEALSSTLTGLGMEFPNALKSAQEQGARLVSCGMRDGGQTVIAQWVYLPETSKDACEVEATAMGAKPVTGCYRVMEDPPANIMNNTASQEEREAFVAACLGLGI